MLSGSVSTYLLGRRDPLAVPHELARPLSSLRGRVGLGRELKIQKMATVTWSERAVREKTVRPRRPVSPATALCPFASIYERDVCSLPLSRMQTRSKELFAVASVGPGPFVAGRALGAWRETGSGLFHRVSLNSTVSGTRPLSRCGRMCIFSHNRNCGKVMTVLVVEQFFSARTGERTVCCAFPVAGVGTNERHNAF